NMDSSPRWLDRTVRIGLEMSVDVLEFQSGGEHQHLGAVEQLRDLLGGPLPSLVLRRHPGLGRLFHDLLAGGVQAGVERRDRRRPGGPVGGLALQLREQLVEGLHGHPFWQSRGRARRGVARIGHARGHDSSAGHRAGAPTGSGQGPAVPDQSTPNQWLISIYSMTTVYGTHPRSASGGPGRLSKRFDKCVDLSPAAPEGGTTMSRSTTRSTLRRLLAGGLTAALATTGALTVATGASAQVSTGQYYQLIAVHSGKAIQIDGPGAGAMAVQWTPGSGANQQFRFEPSGSGYYRLVARHSGMVLDVFNWNPNNGAEIRQWTDLNGTNQQWSIVDRGNNQISLINRFSGKALDVWEWSTANGARISQYDSTGGANQRFQLVPVDGGGSGPGNPVWQSCDQW